MFEDPDRHKQILEQKRVAYTRNPDVLLQKRLAKEKRIKEERAIKAKEKGWCFLQFMLTMLYQLV